MTCLYVVGGHYYHHFTGDKTEAKKFKWHIEGYPHNSSRSKIWTKPGCESCSRIHGFNHCATLHHIKCLFSSRNNHQKMEIAKKLKIICNIQFSSVARSCLTLCDPMNCSAPGLPVHHQLPESTQTHVHWVSDAIQPSHPLSSPSPALNSSQHQGLFQWVNSLHEVAKVLEFQL